MTDLVAPPRRVQEQIISITRLRLAGHVFAAFGRLAPCPDQSPIQDREEGGDVVLRDSGAVGGEARSDGYWGCRAWHCKS
jgi:hypothetical protein